MILDEEGTAMSISFSTPHDMCKSFNEEALENYNQNYKENGELKNFKGSRSVSLKDILGVDMARVFFNGEQRPWGLIGRMQDLNYIQPVLSNSNIIPIMKMYLSTQISFFLNEQSRELDVFMPIYEKVFNLTRMDIPIALSWDAGENGTIIIYILQIITPEDFANALSLIVISKRILDPRNGKTRMAEERLYFNKECWSDVFGYFYKGTNFGKKFKTPRFFRFEKWKEEQVKSSKNCYHLNMKKEDIGKLIEKEIQSTSYFINRLLSILAYHLTCNRPTCGLKELLEGLKWKKYKTIN